MVHYCRRFIFISPSVFPRLPLLGRFTILSFHCGCCLASFYLRVLMHSVDLCVSVATVFQNGISLALSGLLHAVCLFHLFLHGSYRIIAHAGFWPQRDKTRGGIIVVPAYNRFGNMIYRYILVIPEKISICSV